MEKCEELSAKKEEQVHLSTFFQYALKSNWIWTEILHFLKVVYIGSIGAGADRLVQECEKLVVEQESKQVKEKRQEHLQEKKQEQKTGQVHLKERKHVQEERQESKQVQEEMQKSIPFQEELQERMHVQKQGQELEQNSNVEMGGQVGTIDKKEGKAYHGEVGGRQKVENEAGSESDVLRSNKQISEASSSGKEKEQQGFSEAETCRGDESINDEKEKDVKLRESPVEEDVGRPDDLVEGIVSKDTSDEENEDIMREIEDQLKDM